MKKSFLSGVSATASVAGLVHTFAAEVVIPKWITYQTLTKAMRTISAHSHLATTTQIFDVVTMSSGMGCIVTNVTVHTWRQKNASLSPCVKGPSDCLAVKKQQYYNKL